MDGIGWDVAFSFILVGGGDSSRMPTALLSCWEHGNAPSPVGAGFIGRKQKDSQFNGMCRAMVRGTGCKLQCRSLRLCLSFPMLHLAVVLPAVHGGALSTHDSARFGTI